MSRDDVVERIEELPAPKMVRAYARGLVFGLPDWAPDPDDLGHLKNTHRIYLEWQAWGIVHQELTITIDDDRGAPVFAYEYKRDDGSQSSRGGPITDRDVWELLRQFTGMVALTGGG
jgi:hypothetical protein